MKQYQKLLNIRTAGKGPVEITDKVQQVVAEARIQQGICLVLVQHTSASLVVTENADPTARGDLQRWLDHAAPEDEPYYRHTLEGRDDMPSHIKSAVTGVSHTLPISGGMLALGTWQGLFLWEHRDRGHNRRIFVHVMGE